MAILEMQPIVIASLHLRSKGSWKQTVVLCDNNMGVINKGHFKTPTINRFLRPLTWTCVKGNFITHAVYIPGCDNTTAGMLLF